MELKQYLSYAVCERQETKLSNIHHVSSSGLLVRDEGGTQVRARVVLTHPRLNQFNTFNTLLPMSTSYDAVSLLSN